MLELVQTSCYLANLGYATLLVQLATVSVLEASSFCQMRRQQSPSGEDFMGQSMWSTFLNGSVFSPVPGREALRSLLTQTNELVGVMNNFKRRYVSRLRCQKSKGVNVFVPSEGNRERKKCLWQGGKSSSLEMVPYSIIFGISPWYFLILRSF